MIDLEQKNDSKCEVMAIKYSTKTKWYKDQTLNTHSCLQMYTLWNCQIFFFVKSCFKNNDKERNTPQGHGQDP